VCSLSEFEQQEAAPQVDRHFLATADDLISPTYSHTDDFQFFCSPLFCSLKVDRHASDERQPLEETLEISATAHIGQIFSLTGTVK
jgi:hypothetical protein